MVLAGVDQSEDLLGVAKKRCPKMVALVGNVSSVPPPDGYADLAVALHVVEHLPQPDPHFTEVRRILRQGGLLVVAITTKMQSRS
jgi:ubiquinone/menaquinone biosynthesis C-methylase UbiE